MDDSLNDFDVPVVREKSENRRSDADYSVKKKKVQQCHKKERTSVLKDVTSKANELMKKDASVQCGPSGPSYHKSIDHVTHRTLIMKILWCKDSTVNFCFGHGLLRAEKQCPTCLSPMSLMNDSKVSDGKRWYCRKSGQNKHEHRISIRSGSFFEKSNMTLEEILEFVYFWVHGMPQTSIHHELGLSSRTDVDWASFCREVCESEIMGHKEKIGGDGIVVEIDESKFAKRKYNVGHRVTGGWVFGGREKDNKKKVFMVPVENRTAETLLGIIQEWIKPGSIIWSDCWKSYGRIPQLPEGYQHGTVNHSQNFVDPESGVCTNRIESDWRHAKSEFPRYGTRPAHYTGYLSVFMWKRKHEGEDLFMAMLAAIGKTYPGQ